jgi:hypothetical protein
VQSFETHNLTIVYYVQRIHLDECGLNTIHAKTMNLRGGGGVKDDGVESFRRCCALMIGLEWISGE